mgnify:FL=1
MESHSNFKLSLLAKFIAYCLFLGVLADTIHYISDTNTLGKVSSILKESYQNPYVSITSQMFQSI